MAAKVKAKTKAANTVPPLPYNALELLNKHQICRALKIRERRLYSMLATGDFPEADTKIGNQSRWLVSTLNRWIKKQCGLDETSAG